jgi:hypothetical protein
MRLKIDDKEITIRWAHCIDKVEGLKRGINGNTNCEIIINQVVDGVERTTGIHYGGAMCMKMDNYCKETGRKISLARALKSAFPKDRDTRATVWEHYHARAEIEQTKRYRSAAQKIAEHYQKD